MPNINDIIVRKPTDEEKSTCSAWPIWECKPSEFNWEYTQVETCLIIEGEVSICNLAGDNCSVNFGPGDLVIFPFGLQCVWKITKPVKKHYEFS